MAWQTVYSSHLRVTIPRITGFANISDFAATSFRRAYSFIPVTIFCSKTLSFKAQKTSQRHNWNFSNTKNLNKIKVIFFYNKVKDFTISCVRNENSQCQPVNNAFYIPKVTKIDLATISAQLTSCAGIFSSKIVIFSQF